MSQPAVAENEPHADAVRVLVIDDNEGDYYLIKSLLNHVGGTDYDTIWLPTGENLAARVSEIDPGICLIDYNLGLGSGLELVEELSKTHPLLPTVILTGQAQHEIDVAAMRVGASDFVEKSQFSSQMLDRTIRYALEQKRNERHLLSLVERDELTGLYNRAGFAEKLETARNVADRTDRLLAVMFLDLDRFKHVNDSLGHAVGDALLCEVARRLSDCCRTTDIIARMGGDEFAIIATHLKHAMGAGMHAEKIVGAMAAPFELGEHVVHVGISIGVTTYPTDVGDSEQLLMNADMALYRAKEQGRNRYVLFDAEMDRAAKARRRTESDLHHAIVSGELFIEYQPIVDARTGRLAALEALIRWRHQGRVRVPGSFIKIAETSNLINRIGEWVMHEACRAAARWRHGPIGSVPVAVNLSPVQLAAPDMVDTILTALAETDLPARMLELEITESVMIPDIAGGERALRRLRELGVRVSVDDFGTGYTALHVLRNLPVDRLKIDRSFIAEIDSPRAPSPIVKAVTEIGRSFGLKVVAEGVETADQIACLRKLGVDLMQGFHISRPMPAGDVVSWHEQWRHRSNLP